MADSFLGARIQRKRTDEGDVLFNKDYDTYQVSYTTVVIVDFRFLVFLLRAQPFVFNKKTKKMTGDIAKKKAREDLKFYRSVLCT